MSSPPSFLTTRWSLIAAARGEGETARRALGELIRAYWYPLYAFVRRSGLDPHDAEDVVQAFFSRGIEKHEFERVAPDKGSFRSFLRVAIRNFVSNRRKYERAEKRGGGHVVLELDFRDADARLEVEARGIDDPERAFERAWAREVLRGALVDLERDYTTTGRRAVFDALKAHLQVNGDVAEYESVARQLGMTTGAVKVAVHRLRGRFRQSLHDRIAETVGGEDELEDEIAALFRALAR